MRPDPLRFAFEQRLRQADGLGDDCPFADCSDRAAHDREELYPAEPFIRAVRRPLDGSSGGWSVDDSDQDALLHEWFPFRGRNVRGAGARD
ncbi:hypothetical protein GCM10009587_14230 [Microbacterium maritypicum]